MTFLVRESSGSTEIGEIGVREGAGLSPISEMWVRDASGLVQVFGSFSLTPSHTDVSGSTSSFSPIRINTTPVVVTVHPAGSVDSILWTIDAAWQAISPTSLMTSFRSPELDYGDSASTTATCTVTRGTATAHIDVNAFCTNLGH